MEHKFKISDTFADESKVTRDPENRWFVECLEHHTYRTFLGRAGARAFVATGAASAYCEERMADLGNPAPKAEKAPRTTKSRFAGTYTVEQAANIVRVAKAGGEEFAKSRSWAVRVAGETVAPKWLVTKLTGLPVSEFTTADAVTFLGKLGLKAYKA